MKTYSSKIPAKRRTELALIVAAVFLIPICLFVFPWVVSLSQEWQKWLGVGLIVALIFVMMVVVIAVQEPGAFKQAYLEWKTERTLRNGKKIHERQMTQEHTERIRNKYPGLF